MAGRSRRQYSLWYLALLLVIAGADSARSTTAAHFWSHAFGGSAGNDGVFDVAVDVAGNVVATGYFRGTIDFGGGPLVSAGGDDIFIVKYNPSGKLLWSKRFGGTGDDQGRAVALDQYGLIYFVGYFYNTVNFGGLSDLTSFGANDIAVVKFDGSGNHVFDQQLGGTGIDIPTGIVLDASNNYSVTGFFSGTSYFYYDPFVSAGAYDVFLVQYTTTQVFRWARQFGGTSSELATGLAVDAAGNIYMTGYFQNTSAFGGSSLVSAGSNDIFLAKHDIDGVHQWSQRFGGTDDDQATAVGADAAGNVAVTGWFGASVNFGGGILTSAGYSDGFLALYDPTGAHQWSRNFESTVNGWGGGVAMDADGRVAVIGTFAGTANLGGSTLFGPSYDDLCVATYDLDGTHVWSQVYGGTGSDYAGPITMTGGAIVAGGEFDGIANFGGATFTSAGGSQDAFVAKYAAFPGEPRITSITDVGNDQGRNVRIEFRRSAYDDPDAPVNITRYEAYRRDDPPPPNAVALPSVLATRAEMLAQGWQFVGSTPAHGEDESLIQAPTVGDSTIVEGQYDSVFFIRAATDDPLVFYDSAADSGYSVDNIPPPAPTNLVYNVGTLGWLPSTAADFDYFTVYASSSPTFDASAVLDGHTVGTSFDVTGDTHTYFYVTATDFSGNEGAPARVYTLSQANGTPPPLALAIDAYPNPFNPSTTIHYEVPATGRVVVGIYGASGARVATLVDRERDAGTYTVGWEGRDDRGAVVSSGIYFARVTLNGLTKTRKIALVK